MNKSIAQRCEEIRQRQGTWAELPEYPRHAWRHEVEEQNTQLGYWDWVEHQLEADNNDALRSNWRDD
jgi:hypothetical protein